MYTNDGIELLFTHVKDHTVAQNPRVVHHNVQLAKRINRALNDPLCRFEIRDALVIGYGFSASCFNFLNNLLRWAVIGASAIKASTKVVDDDFCSMFCQQEGFLATNASSGARNDCNLSI